MFWIEGLLLCIMMVSGILCSKKDIKEGIVPNRWLIRAAIPALIIQIIYILIYASEYLSGWLLSMFFADVFAVMLYAAGIWAAGDVKLFFLMFLCVPGRILDSGGLTYAVVPYIYIFIPAILWVAGDTVIQIFSRSERFTPERFRLRDIPEIVAVMIEITVLQIIVWGIVPEFCNNNELFVSASMLICAYILGSSQWMKQKIVVALCLVIIVVFMYFKLWVYSPAEWWVYAIVAGVMLFQSIASSYNYRRIPTNEVSKGMILSAGTVLMFSVSKVMGLPQNASESMSAKISEEEAQAIKRWEKSKHGSSTIVIVRKIPFASLVSLGMTLWMIIRISGV